eukprot:TRINITY_DN26588_c0_g1_i1.p1 TRINITY_DN26588_c0_g1~~TRINITY_DN26588_c0_g1_i1.p1  ORF type:complete len:291 (-),score=41.76 TRINITY_DN26588_c0_g1_i1:331-1203(-)
MYGHSWGEGAARCFRVDDDFDEASGARLSPIPDCFVCPLTTTVMTDPVMTADGCVYERDYIEHWIRTRRQQKLPVTSPSTNMELQFTQLVPLLALKKAIEAYLMNRPELKKLPMEKKTLQQAAAFLQEELQVKEARHKSLREERDVLRHQMEQAFQRIARLEEERDLLQSRITRLPDEGSSLAAFPSAANRAASARMMARTSRSNFDAPPRPPTLPSRGLWVDDFIMQKSTTPRDRASSPAKGESPFIQYNVKSKTDADEHESIGASLFSALTNVFTSPTGCCARHADKE